jgi:TrmH family RNA methyltransferase
MISSRHNPIVARYRAAARGESAGAVLLDGMHLIVEAIQAGLRIHEVAMTSEAADRPEVAATLTHLAGADVGVVLVSGGVMSALSPVKSSTGIAALADRPPPAGDRVYAQADPLVIIAIDVQDPGNLGAMVRVAEAGGAGGFITAGACADPFGWRALRGSMGSAMRVPIAVQRDATTAVDEARRRGCRIFATAPRGGQSVFDVDYAGAIAVLIGGEGSGLPSSLLSAADQTVMVPMQPPVESLNAAVTTALIVYEAFRQRTRLRHPVAR